MTWSLLALLNSFVHPAPPRVCHVLDTPIARSQEAQPLDSAGRWDTKTPRVNHCSSIVPGHCLSDPQTLTLAFFNEQSACTLWFGSSELLFSMYPSLRETNPFYGIFSDCKAHFHKYYLI